MKRAVIYTRISDARAALLRLTLTATPDANDLERGVDRQMKDCDKVAERGDYDVVARFKENDLSAYKKNVVRPKFEQILGMVKNGDIDVIIVWHIDRYLRRSRDLERLIEVADKGVQVIGAQSGQLDLSTAAGRMTARILVAVAEQESEHHAERRILANTQRAENGEWSSANRCFGYTTDGQPLEPEATAIREAVADILAGKSIRSIARQWNAAGITTTKGNTWDGAQIRLIIVNPRYAALLTHRGAVYPGTWTPLITVDKHHALIAFLNNPARRNSVSWEQKHLGTGLYLCGVCGSTLQSHAHRRLIYRCRTPGHLSIDATYLDRLVIGRILGWFAKENAHLLISNPVDMTELSTQRLAVAAKLDSLATLFATDAIDATQLATASKELRARLAALDTSLLAATGSSPAATLLHTSQAAHAARQDAGEAVAAMWESMTVTQRAAAVDAVTTVTISKIRRRGPGFDAGRVDMKPRRTA